MSDYESFSSYAVKARNETLDELKHTDLATSKRVALYPFGAAERFLLDRLNPNWKNEYFKHLFSLDTFFVGHVL